MRAMYDELKKKIESELVRFMDESDKKFLLRDTSPLIFDSLKEYVLRDGKRIRPILILMGFRGYADKDAPGLYTTALSIELLHDFMLIHDDIIDKSDLRRGEPAMHTVLNDYVKKFKDPTCTGADLGIAIGDILYSIGIDAFLAVDVPFQHKQKALSRFIRAGVFTGMGEFYEMENGLKPAEEITKESIYKVYDYKTAYYTFAYPICIGAMLAGAPDSETDALCEYGTLLGRAFQIKDDIIGMFQDEQEIGKSATSDLEEGKKTLLIWYGYKNGTAEQKKTFGSLLGKKAITRDELGAMRKALTESGALEACKAEICTMNAEAQKLLAGTKVNLVQKTFLAKFADKILAI